MAEQRLSRKEIRQPDQFISFSVQALNWAQEHSRYLIYGALAVVNPVMNQRIDWAWFVGSQFAFGIVAGIVVAKQEQIPTRQSVPLTERLGVEASGVARETPEDPR